MNMNWTNNLFFFFMILRRNISKQKISYVNYGVPVCITFKLATSLCFVVLHFLFFHCLALALHFSIPSIEAELLGNTFNRHQLLYHLYSLLQRMKAGKCPTNEELMVDRGDFLHALETDIKPVSLNDIFWFISFNYRDLFLHSFIYRRLVPARKRWNCTSLGE